MKKRVLACVLSVCLLVGLLPATALATGTYGDTNGHWAEKQIDRWSDYGIVQGDGENFFPNDDMTRGQAAAVFARLLGLTEKADVSEFTDLEGNFYKDYIALCVAAGIMNGVGGGLMDPNGTLTREQMFVMFARAMGIAPKETATRTFADADKISPWSKGYINALADLGYVRGIGGNEVAPQLEISRASVMALLDQSITVYVAEDGASVDITGDGIALIAASGVTATGTAPYVVVAPGADDGIVTLKGATVDNLTVSASDATVILSDGAKAETVTMTETSENSKVITESEPDIPSVPSHTHNYTLSEEVEPTCTTPGSKTYTCSCGDSYTEEVPTLAHTEEIIPGKPACTEDGLTEGKKCSVCGEILVAQEAIPVKGHTWGDDDICDDCGATKAEALKFYLAVSSGGQTVDATAYDDYSAAIKVDGGNVDASSVTIKMEMQNVASLGVGEKRTYENTVETGLTGDGALRTWLSNAWEFGKEGKAATLNVTIDGKKVTYTLTGEEETVGDPAVDGTTTAYIYGTPGNVQEAREAWQALTAKITTDGKTADDSYITIKNGSYLQIGTEKLEFETGDDLILDNFNDVDALKDNIKSNVKLTTDAAAVTGVKAVLKQGTTLAVSSSWAVLKEDATITITGIDENVLKNALSNIRDKAQGTSNYDLAVELMHLVNNLMGSIQGNTVEINITFAGHSHIEETIPAVEATCTEAGLTEGKKCSVCGEILTAQEEIPALGHTEETIPATVTCTQDGLTEGKKCSVCGEITSEQTEAKALFHEWDENGNCTNCGATQEAAKKFYLAVSSGGQTVDANAYDDYTAAIKVDGGNVDASSVTIKMEMQNVASLGVGEKRTYENTVETGLTGDGALRTWLSNAWEFGKDGKAAELSVTINGKKVTYTLTGKEEIVGDPAVDGTTTAYIYGTPGSVQEAREAWKALTDKITTENKNADDSYITIANGSYLQIGDEKLEFEIAEDLKLDNFNDISALKQNIKDHVKLTEVAGGTGVTAVLKAGTTLAVSSSWAVLKEDATITITGIDNAVLENALSNIREKAQGTSNYDLAVELMNLVNNLMGSIQGKTVEINITIGA